MVAITSQPFKNMFLFILHIVEFQKYIAKPRLRCNLKKKRFGSLFYNYTCNHKMHMIKSERKTQKLLISFLKINCQHRCKLLVKKFTGDDSSKKVFIIQLPEQEFYWQTTSPSFNPPDPISTSQNRQRPQSKCLFFGHAPVVTPIIDDTPTQN